MRGRPPTTPVPPSPRRLPALDGLRGMAFVGVFLGHAGLAPELAVGQVAMFVFFGLSGFLISATLGTERARTGRISLLRFYARRALRLVPGLCAFLAVWLLVAAVFGDRSWIATVPGSTGPSGGISFTVALEGVAGALSYSTNWCGLFGVFTGYVPLGHLWSLAVEEQFYLLWAPLLIVMARRRAGVAVVGALVLAAASFVDAAWWHHAPSTTPWLFYSTDTRAGVFLVGGAAGLAWAHHRAVAQWCRRWGTPLAIVALGTLAWAGWVFDHTVSVSTYSASWIAVSLASVVLVVAVAGRTRGRSWLAGPVATYVGTRSYGLYLWHYVWLTWLHGFGLLGTGTALAATFGCAEVSWRLVETPFLRLKRRVGEAQAPAVVDLARPVVDEADRQQPAYAG